MPDDGVPGRDDRFRLVDPRGVPVEQVEHVPGRSVIERPGEMIPGPSTGDDVGIPIVGHSGPVDRGCRLTGSIEVASQDGGPDDMNPQIGVGVGGELVLHLTGAGETGRSEGVDQQDQPRATLVAFERSPDLIDAAYLDHVGSSVGCTIGFRFVGEEVHVVVEAWNRDPNPW